jgi:hypothetical protein
MRSPRDSFLVANAAYVAKMTGSAIAVVIEDWRSSSAHPRRLSAVRAVPIVAQARQLAMAANSWPGLDLPACQLAAGG